MSGISPAIAGLEPAALWHYFAELNRIPRESKHEKAAGDYVVRVAKELGLPFQRDAVGSVVVRKPASPGREHVRSLCLQGHLDMVCVARPGKVHDFAKDPIVLVRDGDEMGADGTTLGADNGIAVATSLAIMADRSLEHGPLELLFTVDEETGLTGAQHLGAGMLTSRTLINLDTEEEGVLCVGCAGGCDSIGTWTLACEPVRAGAVALEVRVTGLKGGHSGGEIHKGRGNAIKMLHRVLAALAAVDARIARMEGGSKRNAIPAEAAAVVCVAKAKREAACAVVAAVRDVLRAEIGTVEPGLDVIVASPRSRPARVYRRPFQRQVMRTLSGLPHGVTKMSAEIPGLVETSTNVAVLVQTPRTLSLATSQRSMVASEIHEIIDSVRAIFELGGAAVSGTDAYPGWKPDLGSAVLAIAVRTHRELYGTEPKVEAVHAGLECGIIGEKFPGMDMVSLGPTITGAHSPDERANIPSVARYWDYLLAILKNVE
jgi:dipeptidase D